MIEGWGEPYQSWMGLRCTEAKWVQAFIEEGSIKFGTPQKWVNEASENIGRGDPYEGLIATAPQNDTKRIYELRKQHPGLIEDKHDGQIILRSERSMKLPAYCYYCISNDFFKCPSEPGEHTVSGHIPAEYFKDFRDPDPAFVMFKLAEFHRRLINWLKNHGVSENAIMIRKIQYYEFEPGMWIEINEDQPMELFCKCSRFRVQNEGRIVINTDDKDVLELLSQPIKIGCLKDIAQGADHAVLEQKHGIDVSMQFRIEAR